jgi:hypothetical protein
MNRHWGPRDRHYVAVIPGDPRHVYMLRNGRWVLSPVPEGRFRADLEGSLALPPPPLPSVPLPRVKLGVDLKVLLFD